MKRNEKIALRRIQILEGAISCFVKSGFHQTSMRDISQASQVSLGNLYNHFENKEALIFAIAEEEAKEIEELMALLGERENPRADMSACDQILKFARIYLKSYAAYDSAVLMVEIAAEAARNQAFAKAFRKNQDELLKALRHTLQRGMKQGNIDPALELAEAAQFILETLEARIGRCLFSQRDFNAKDWRSVRLALEKYLRPAP